MSNKNKSEISGEQAIAFIDSSTSISELEKILDKNKISVITFDYISHVKLKNKNIVHVVSDNYNNSNINELQKQCYTFLKWYDEKVVKDNLQFNGVNIPKLFTEQLWHSIVKIVKKFVEVQKIYNKYPNSKYFASGNLLEIIKIFTTSCTKLGNDIPEEFYLDKIEVGINLWKKELVLSISRSWYDKIKNIGEDLLLFFTNNNIEKNKKTILLVEFDTKKFEGFLLESKKHNMNILFYGRRRPAIWDLKSFMIIKESGCDIITRRKLCDKSFFRELETTTNSIREQLLFLLQNDEHLYNFFEIDNISIWPLIKPKIKNLIGNRIKTIIYEILLARKMFESYKINSVLVISEAGLTEQIVVRQAKNFNVPVFHLQEGLYFDTPEAFDNENFQGVYPELADEYFVWGNIFEDDAIKNAKVDPQKIKVFGSPRFSNLSFDKSLDSEEFVLLATMPPQIEEVVGHNVQNLEKYFESILKICEIVSNQKKRLIIKLHPTFDVLEISKNLKKKFPNVKVISKDDINPLIRKCSVLIVTGLSTVITQAQILQKPVISIQLIDYNWGNPSVFKSGSCITASLTELDKLIKRCIDDRTFRNEIIKNGNIFLEKCIKERMLSSKKTWEYIYKFN